MKNDIYLIGGVGEEINLASVIGMVEQSNKDEPLNVHIHSGGGSVYDGLAIYNYLKGLEQEVNTHSSGLVASIASIIFLAGKKRTINSMDNFLIHLPMSGSIGNAIDLEKTAKELRDIESKLAKIYALETNITEEIAIELMQKDEMMNVSNLIEQGFVSEIIEFKAVATLNQNQNNNNIMSEQLTKKDAENLFDKFFNKFLSKKQPTNKIVQDANGVEIDFTEVEEEATPTVGDTAMVEGEKASGDYVMPNGETFKFEEGTLSEIVEAESTEEEQTEEEATTEVEVDAAHKSAEVVNELTKQNDDLIAQIEEIKNSFETLKSEVTSKFDYDNKQSTEEKVENNSRKLFK